MLQFHFVRCFDGFKTFCEIAVTFSVCRRFRYICRLSISLAIIARVLDVYVNKLSKFFICVRYAFRIFTYLVSESHSKTRSLDDRSVGFRAERATLAVSDCTNLSTTCSVEPKPCAAEVIDMARLTLSTSASYLFNCKSFTISSCFCFLTRRVKFGFFLELPVSELPNLPSLSSTRQ